MFTAVLLYFILTILLLLIAVKLYIKLITGINKCSRHLVGKVVIVTGGNAGIGFETAKDLADRGAKVIIACRNEGRGNKAKEEIIAATENKDVHYKNLDLASFASVRRFANDIISTEKRLDILINNAGVIDASSVSDVKTEDGLHFVMQTNHFGPFLLTNLLLPKLKESTPSRIVNVSSQSYKSGELDIDDLNMKNKTNFETFGTMIKMYSYTKLCNVLMTLELEDKLKGTGVTANACHPGAVGTTIMNGVSTFWFKYLCLPIFKVVSKSNWEGAQTTIYLAVSPEVKDVSGRFFSDCKEEKLNKVARNPELQRILWKLSEKIVKH